MKNHLKKISFLILGIILIPSFVGAQKSVVDFKAGDITCSAGNSIAKNASATWGITGLGAFDSPLVTWSGSGVSGTGLSTMSTYSVAGPVNNVIATIADESGSVQVACSPLSIKDTTNDTGGSTGGGGGSVSSNSCTLLGNVNGDTKCSVDIFDFNSLILNWGSTSVGNSSDLNKDGIVDILDFNTLMLNWTGTL